ncbi:MAG: molybdate ABC transporter substrate-binding protein [Armatimonadetes bacterium]|nr:molybdate ABC transporter substrate-binding protein [Armatimonadota bacterium]
MVFAGAGLKAPLQEIAQDFTNKHKCEVDFTFSDYKTLAEEIENGAKPDVLITSPEYMQVLKEKGVLDHYQELTAKVPVIVVAKTNPKAITSLEDLTKSDVKLALPDQDQSHLVGGCVGEEVLKKAKLSEKVHLIKPAPATVEGLLKAVTNGTADATIIWNDQAVRYDQKDITAIKLPQYGQKVMIALLREAPHREKAEEFFAFICSQEGKKLFKELGYGGK